MGFGIICNPPFPTFPPENKGVGGVRRRNGDDPPIIKWKKRSQKWWEKSWVKRGHSRERVEAPVLDEMTRDCKGITTPVPSSRGTEYKFNQSI